ncbi:MAG: ABC transporter substrate-binding protein [Chloroflexota bacterium]
MNTRRSVFTASLPAALGLAACGATGNAPPPADTGPATIKLTTTWTSGTRATVMKELIDQFQQTNPRLKVEQQVVTPAPGSNYADAVLIQLTTASAADVIQGDPQTIVQWQESGAPFADLTARVKTDRVQLDDFFGPRGVAWERTGKIHGLPFQQSSGTTYGYCVTQFEQLNLTLPNKYAGKPGGWWDWSDFLAVLQRIKRDTDRDGTPDVWGAYVRNNYQAWWGRFVESNGGAALNPQRTKTTLESAQAIEGFEFIADLVRRHQVALWEDTLPAFRDAVGDPFGKGVIGVSQSVDLPGAISMLERGQAKWSLAHIPTAPKTGKSIPAINNEPQMVYGQSKVVDAAFQWIKFGASKDVQLRLANTSGVGVIPSLKSVAKGDSWMGQYPELKKVVIESSEKAVALPFHGKYQRWQTAIQTAAAKAFRGEVSAREAMLEATREGDKVLAGQ